MDSKLRQLIEKQLAVVDDHDTTGPRLRDDGRRLWDRVRRLLSLDLIAQVEEPAALELACYALQLPMRQRKMLPAGKLGRTSLKDRAEQASELLVSLLEDQIDETLLERATQLLRAMPQRAPAIDAARLLADAVNLEDFGASGLAGLCVQLARQGDGVAQLAEGIEKREQYGYWEARLKEGFHFEPVRQIARRRLDNARQVAKLLASELREDRPD